MQDKIESLDEKSSTLLQEEEVQKLLMRKMIELGIEQVAWRKEHILQTLPELKGMVSAVFKPIWVRNSFVLEMKSK